MSMALYKNQCYDATLSRLGAKANCYSTANIFLCSDLAVGAPYDGPEQRGAVYIFLGSREGIVKKPSQVGVRHCACATSFLILLLFTVFTYNLVEIESYIC